jgi:hypothetical protein
VKFLYIVSRRLTDKSPRRYVAVFQQASLGLPALLRGTPNGMVRFTRTMSVSVWGITVTDMRRALVAALVAVVAPLSLAACSGSIAPTTWATSVCQSLTPWRASIATLNQNAQTAMATAKTPEQTRAHMLDLLSGAQRASEKARLAVAAAGVPDVQGGAVIEKRFVTALAAVRDAYARADHSISALPMTDASTFYSGVSAAMTTLNADYAKSGVDITALASPELQADFAKVAACR